MKNILILLPILFQNVLSKPYVNIWQEQNYHENAIVPSCSSLIYCQGTLLDQIQQAGIFNDSKTFVDMSLVNSSAETLENFEALMNETNDNPTLEQLEKFVEENFVSEAEITEWTPPDYTDNPEFLSKIKDEDVKKFAQQLVAIWPKLGRKLVDDVAENPDKHSMIPVPNAFIIPGGRFKELYYWDSYWIIKGLLLSEMKETVKGMLDNFIYLIETYGFIPNGARVYYTNRSQPPLFTSMVAQYIQATNDTTWLANNIKHLEAEPNFWLKNKTTVVEKDGVKYELAHYNVKSNTPRPESYVEDVETCGYFTEENEKSKCYRRLKSGAETGMDFSTRWFFSSSDDTTTNLTFIDTPRVIPVDLNAILSRAFKDISDFHGMLGDKENQVTWLEKSKTWKKAIEEVFYDKQDGIWYDYDVKERKPRKYFYPTNFAPLWADAYDLSKKDDYGRKAAKYFEVERINDFQGGVPTSLVNSGEQWDLPNAWPPHQDFVVTGLLKSGNENAVRTATDVAEKWVNSNMEAYDSTGVMFEKYDAINPGQYGGGGEYTVQSGFGWSNGVVLNFIYLFYSD